MPITSYSSPVNQLLTYGECHNISPTDWPNYLKLGISAAQIPELIRMATDEKLYQANPNSLKFWAPIHAWRTLGQLQAQAAIEPLIGLFPKRDGEEEILVWIGEELPIVLSLIGPAAIPALAGYLADRSKGVFSRTIAISSLEEISVKHPDCRTCCVTVLTHQLESFQENGAELNSFIVAGLLDLRAIESASVIEPVFKTDCVDQTITGNWNEVQVKLGLKSRADVLKKGRERKPATLRELLLGKKQPPTKED
ncbi:MAG: hypothetical protein JOZ78_00585 [Chroococcidiopsidaceae cyanobacterium CP_BM_ER_R8_30]|nr:hypothetical protein [Chroococcidiopsidaceae cyanobacterium CP_BM_ER_R8_30]